MTSNKPPSEADRQNKIVAEARQSRNQREKTYREKALKMYPWVCARCGREFSGKKLLNSPCITGITTMTTTHPTAATGNCCVSTATTTNTPAMRIQRPMAI